MGNLALSAIFEKEATGKSRKIRFLWNHVRLDLDEYALVSVPNCSLKVVLFQSTIAGGVNCEES